MPFGGAGSTLLNGLVSWWWLNETNGVREDSVGSNDLTDNNTVGYTAGKIGNAAAFVAASQQSIAGDSLKLPDPFDQSFTISYWVRANALNAPTWGFTNVAGISGTTGLSSAYNTHPSSELVNYTFRLGETGGGAGALLANAWGAVELNGDKLGWQHIILTWDGTTFRLNWNDTTKDSATMAGGTTAESWKGAQVFQFGAFHALSSWSDADISDAMIYDRVLSAAEQTALYGLGAGKFHPFTDASVYDLLDYNTAGFAAGKNGNAVSVVKENNESLKFDAGVGEEGPLKASTGLWGISAWLYIDSADLSNTGLLLTGDNGTNYAHAFDVDFLTATTNVRFSIYTNDPQVKTINFAAAQGLNDVAWNYFACWNEGDGYVRGTVNGNALVTSTVVLNSTDFRSCQRFSVSGRHTPHGADQTFKCDELELYARPLSLEEAVAKYAAGAGRFYDFNTL